MFAQRITPQDLIDRLNSDAYAPKYVESDHKLINSGVKLQTLGAVTTKKINNSIRNVKGELDAPGATIPMYRPADISGGISDSNTAPLLTRAFEASHEKSRVFPGDIVLGIAGSVGVVGRVQKGIQYGNINGSSARIATDSDFKSAYLLAYFQSKYGQASLLRYGVGSVQKHLNLEDLPFVTVATPAEPTQKYIGDKVRQAERLRAWAKDIELGVQEYHQSLIPSQCHLNFGKKTRKVSFKRMAERLDAHFYPGVVDDYLKHDNVVFQPLRALCLKLANGQTQKETALGQRCEQITVTNLSPSFVKGEPRLVEAPANKERFTKPHDLLMCNAAHNKSYIGRELTYCHSDKAVLPSTEVMVIRTDRQKIPASYLRTYLLTKLGFIQLQSTIRGITAHSYPVDVAKLDIPVPQLSSVQKSNWLECDDLMLKAGKAVELSTRLTRAAKYMVEALIEGQLTEQQLIDAEASQTANHAILQRLKTDGFDGKGAPLFPDLDQLEQLLEESADH